MLLVAAVVVALIESDKDDVDPYPNSHITSTQLGNSKAFSVVRVLISGFLS